MTFSKETVKGNHVHFSPLWDIRLVFKRLSLIFCYAAKDDLYVTPITQSFHPLSMEEVRLFLEKVSPRFRNFFIIAFFTGMRFGEMAALKWERVDFKKEIIKVKETLVKGITTPPKTKRSSRDIDILPPVMDALNDQKKETFGKSDYVFLNQYGKTIDPMSMNFHVWGNSGGEFRGGIPGTQY